MPVQLSLFSRSNPRPTPIKKVHGFMRLPGEIRNQIYEYYFQEALLVEIAAKGTKLVEKKRKTVKLCLSGRSTPYTIEDNAPDKPRTLRMPRKLGHYTRVDGLRTQWATSLSPLPFVCKQIHVEVLEFLYASTTFVFAAPKRISNFFEIVPKCSLSNITKLQLHYTTYGEPVLRSDRTWITKHRESWTNVCRTISKSLINLRDLVIWIYWTNTDVSLDLKQPYLAPLWHLRRRFSTTEAGLASTQPNLKLIPQTLKVDFRTHWSGPGCFSYPELTRVSQELHREFGIAIQRAILGWKAADAMVDMHETWEKHHAWHFHLSFMSTGW